jgi:Aminotransferase class-V
VTAPTVETLRQEFLLDPDVIFLNHGSFGAAPIPVFAEYQRWQRELEWQPVEFLGRRSDDLLNDARSRMASYLGCCTNNLVFVPNATTGINVVSRSLPVAPGDEVVGTSLEYGACERAWEWNLEQRGARYIRASVPLPVRRPDEVVDAIFAAVTPRTRVIYLSHITSGTALRLRGNAASSLPSMAPTPSARSRLTSRRWASISTPGISTSGSAPRKVLAFSTPDRSTTSGCSRRSSPGAGSKKATDFSRSGASSRGINSRAPATLPRF